MSHDKHVIIGLAMALGLLFIVTFGTIPITGFITSSTTSDFDFRFPLLLVFIVGLLGIVFYVFKAQEKHV